MPNSFYCSEDIRPRGMISFNRVILRGDGWGWGRAAGGMWYVLRGDTVERECTVVDQAQIREVLLDMVESLDTTPE